MTKNYFTVIVVEFSRDKSLVVIPSSWLVEPDKAVWLPLDSRRCQKMVKRKDSPESVSEVFAVKK